MDFCSKVAVKLIISGLEKNAERNILVSPLSYTAIMYMIAAGTTSKTLEQILHFLQHGNIAEVNSAFSQLAEIASTSIVPPVTEVSEEVKKTRKRKAEDDDEDEDEDDDDDDDDEDEDEDDDDNDADNVFNGPSHTETKLEEEIQKRQALELEVAAMKDVLKIIQERFNVPVADSSNASVNVEEPASPAPPAPPAPPA